MVTEQDNPTCGPLFQQVFKEALKVSLTPLALFSWGHLCASAEKIWLGACPAAMFRPTDNEKSFEQRIAFVANVYSLDWMEIGDEYWMFRRQYYHTVKRIMLAEKDSSEYHGLRGLLCGIPVQELDLEFHKRYKNNDN